MAQAQVEEKEFRSFSPEERTQKLLSLKKELFNLRKLKSEGRLDKPHQMRQIRKQIARLLTVQNEEVNTKK